MPPTPSGRRRAVAALSAAPMLGAAALAGGGARPAHAQARFPARPIRVVVPFPPGQTADVFARLPADKATDPRWRDTRIIVENKPGGGTIGMQAAARSAPDGYTLAFGSLATLAVNPALMGNLPHDVWHDFVPVLRVFENPLLLVVPAAGPPDMEGLLQRAWAGGVDLRLQRRPRSAPCVGFAGRGEWEMLLRPALLLDRPERASLTAPKGVSLRSAPSKRRAAPTDHVCERPLNRTGSAVGHNERRKWGGVSGLFVRRRGDARTVPPIVGARQTRRWTTAAEHQPG